VIEVNRRFAAERPDVPLHLGVTEAGMPPDGIIKTNADKPQEIAAANAILADIAAGRVRSVVDYGLSTLAKQVKEMTAYASEHAITIAVMGCRVNGPGETDDADLGLWCGPTHVNLKKGSAELGAFPYDAILPRLREELDKLIAARTVTT